MVSRRILVTKSEINGKKLGSLHFRSMYGVNVTRINRSGMDLFADPNLVLQVGDRVMVVGQQDAVERVAGVLGNQLKRLDTPNIVTIFVGIFLGILLGSLPIAFPGMPTPVKLGLAGGPLVVAILIGRFGHKMHLVTYTTMSANLMLREIGIVLFLASVGIEAGEHFVQTVVEGSGLLYVGYGFLITVIPLLIIGMIARFYCKVNYFTLMGLIAGSNTDPPALAYLFPDPYPQSENHLPSLFRSETQSGSSRSIDYRKNHQEECTAQTGNPGYEDFTESSYHQ